MPIAKERRAAEEYYVDHVLVSGSFVMEDPKPMFETTDVLSMHEHLPFTKYILNTIFVHFSGIMSP